MSTSSLSTIITVPLVRAKALGVRFGTPIPTQVKIVCHLTEGCRLEFFDGSSAEEVAKLFPELVLQARLELMRTLKKREGITTSFHKRTTQVFAPIQTTEPPPRFLREAKAIENVLPLAPPKVIPVVPAIVSVVSLPIARSVTPLPIAQPVAPLPIARSVTPLPIAQPVAPRPIAKPVEALPIAKPVEYAAKRDLGAEFM